MIVRIFCKMVRLHLQRIFIQISNKTRFKVLARDFEKLHKILYIVEVLDKLHIPILALVIGSEDYYCHKSFHLVLLEGIVEVNYVFRNYEFGWTRSLHGWYIF